MRFSRSDLRVVPPRRRRRRHLDPPVRRAAFTLLEVIVGLALMASLLVGSLLAFSSHRRQLRHAELSLQAVDVADELLQRLSGAPGGFPIAARGAVASRPNWQWRTRLIGVATPADLPVNVIRLEVLQLTADRHLRVLTHVDVVEAIR